jgi:hypothetical protein
MKNPLSWYVEKADANVLNDRQDLIELTRFVINACTEQNADFSLTELMSPYSEDDIYKLFLQCLELLRNRKIIDTQYFEE